VFKDGRGQKFKDVHAVAIDVDQAPRAGVSGLVKGGRLRRLVDKAANQEVVAFQLVVVLDKIAHQDTS
jgi:hypothetical protein